MSGEEYWKSEARRFESWFYRANYLRTQLEAENMALRERLAEADGREAVVHCRECDFACVCGDGCLDCSGPLTSGWDYYNDAPLRTIVSPDGFCAWGRRRNV